MADQGRLVAGQSPVAAGLGYGL